MSALRRRLRRREGAVRSLGALVAATALAGWLDGGSGTFFTTPTITSVLQYLATLGLVAVGLGVVMAAGELDLSVAAMAAFGGALAVKTGSSHGWVVGLLAGVAVGAGFGLLQGLAVVTLRISSVAVTLGGLLVLQGGAYVVTGGSTIAFEDLDVVTKLNDPIATVFTWRVIVVIAVVLIAAAVMAWTRVGRDLYAAGSHRRAAVVSGVPTRRLVLGAFVFSGTAAALSGVLLSYSLAAAAPGGLADLLVPAIAATILGGVSLHGGTGNPLCVAIGVLALGVLTSGLTAAGQPSQTQSIYIGVVLLLIALSDSEDLRARWLESPFARRGARVSPRSRRRAGRSA
jgi:ribose/xylose/arabinose/galactoside ABC-type transport system permease subunit